MCFKLKFVEPVLFLYNLYFYGSMPLVSEFVRHLLATEEQLTNVTHIENKTSVCTNVTHSITGAKSRIDANASQILLIMHIAAVLPAFIVIVFFGGFSDKKGRLPILVMPIVGGTLRIVFLIITSFYGLSITLLVLSSLLDGCLGMSSLLFMGCFAYISDITNTTQRSSRTVLLEASGGLGVTLSYLLSGSLVDYIGFLWTFVVLLGLLILTFIYVVFFLKESVVVDDSNVSLCSNKHLKDILKLFIKNDDYENLTDRRLTLFIVFLISVAQFGSLDVQTLFLLKFPLCLTAAWIGYFYALVYIVSNFTNWILTKFLGKILGDLGLAALGSFFGITYFLTFAFSSNTLILFLVPLAGCANMLPTPILRAYGSKIVPANILGLLFAAIAWMQMIGVLVGGVIQNEIYAATVSWNPQIVFFFNSCVFGCVVIILCIYFCLENVFKRRPGYQEIY